MSEAQKFTLNQHTAILSTHNLQELDSPQALLTPPLPVYNSSMRSVSQTPISFQCCRALDPASVLPDPTYTCVDTQSLPHIPTSPQLLYRFSLLLFIDGSCLKDPQPVAGYATVIKATKASRSDGPFPHTTTQQQN
jgi:hypothetical protein